MKKLLVLCLVAPALGCGREVPSGGTSPTIAQGGLDIGVDASPSADSRTPPPVGRCVGTVAEYCASLGGRCPTYQESVERARELCAWPPGWAVTTRACAHEHRSVSWRAPLVGGGGEYFDGGGRLIAAYRFADYGAYCGGRSFTRTFGTIPTCGTQPLTTSLCPGRH